MAEKLCPASLQPRQTDQPDACGRVQLHGKVDIAGRGGLAARQGAEQANMADAGLPQFGRMRAEGRDDLVGCRVVEVLMANIIAQAVAAQ